MQTFNYASFSNLTTERLVIRQLLLTDVDGIIALRNNSIVNQYLKRPGTTTHDEALHFIKKINTAIENKESCYWAITLKESTYLIGTVCLWNFNSEKNTAEIGYELHPSFHHKGLMQEAVKCILAVAFTQFHLAAITACTHIDNTASIKLLAQNNFTLSETPAEAPEEIIYTLTREFFMQG